METIETAVSVVVPRLLSGRQVLELLGLPTKHSRQRLLSLRDAGLPAVLIRGRFLYKAADVVEFIQKRGSASHAAS